MLRGCGSKRSSCAVSANSNSSTRSNTPYCSSSSSSSVVTASSSRAELVQDAGAGSDGIVDSSREGVLGRKAIRHAHYRNSVLKCEQLANAVVRCDGTDGPAAPVKIAAKHVRRAPQTREVWWAHMSNTSGRGSAAS